MLTLSSLSESVSRGFSENQNVRIHELSEIIRSCRKIPRPVQKEERKGKRRERNVTGPRSIYYKNIDLPQTVLSSMTHLNSFYISESLTITTNSTAMSSIANYPHYHSKQIATFVFIDRFPSSPSRFPQDNKKFNHHLLKFGRNLSFWASLP